MLRFLFTTEFTIEWLMLLVVFGAGASYDSVPHHPPLASGAADELRPPLANELFADRPQFVEAMKQFPDCLALIPRLRKHGVVVEQELAILQEQAKTFPPALREIAAIRYYLHFILQQCQESWRRFHFGITNHAALLREIERWRVETGESVCLVTFNYDTMIEEALSQVLHLDRRDIDDYISREYPLVKLHGSANWGREVDGFVQPQDFRAQTLIDNVAVLDITRRYRLVTGYPMLTEGSPHEGFKIVFPALSIPVENKDDFECPESHLKALAGC